MVVHCVCVRYVPAIEVPRVEDLRKIGKGKKEDDEKEGDE